MRKSEVNIGKCNGFEINEKYLSEALEALNAIIFYLKKEKISHSDEILIRLHYQFLGNCLKMLSLAFIKNNPDLEQCIFWKKAGNLGKRAHLFDRMDTAHEADFLKFLDPRYSIESCKSVWLEECTKLRDAINNILPARLRAREQLMVGHNSFDLNVGALSHWQKGNEIESCKGNIWHALELLGTIDVNAHTLPNMAIVLMLNQIISNNLKSLLKLGHAFDNRELVDAIRQNRNRVAHARTFCPFMGLDQGYFCRQYFEQAMKIGRYVTQPHIMPDIVENHADAEAKDDGFEPEAKAPEQDSGVAVGSYYEAHNKLFMLLQGINYIDKAIQINKANSGEDGKIFSDEDLLHILAKCIMDKKIVLFVYILDNLKVYTKTKALELINIPIPCTAKVKKGGAILKDGNAFLRYSSDYKSEYINGLDFYNGVTMSAYREKKYVTTYCQYLLSLSVDTRQKNPFLMKLLDIGANVDGVTKLNTGGGEEPLLFTVFANGSFDIMASLIVDGGANPDVRDGHGDTIISLTYKQKLSTDLLIQLIKYGADPLQKVYIGEEELNCTAPLLYIIMTRLKYLNSKEDILEGAKTIIGLIVDRYGFNAIKTMLGSNITITDNSVGHRSKVVNFPSFSKAITFFNNMQGGIGKCVQLVHFLEALDNSREECELFKVLLTNNLEYIKKFIEEKSSTDLKRLMAVVLEYPDKDETQYRYISKRSGKEVVLSGRANAEPEAQNAIKKEITLREFTKLCCSREIAVFVIQVEMKIAKGLGASLVSHQEDNSRALPLAAAVEVQTPSDAAFERQEDNSRALPLAAAVEVQTSSDAALENQDNSRVLPLAAAVEVQTPSDAAFERQEDNSRALPLAAAVEVQTSSDAALENQEDNSRRVLPPVTQQLLAVAVERQAPQGLLTASSLQHLTAAGVEVVHTHSVLEANNSNNHRGGVCERFSAHCLPL